MGGVGFAAGPPGGGRLPSRHGPARFEYEYTGRFLDEGGRSTLLEQSQKLREQLAPLLQKQKELLDKIEQYSGADWDELYGRTGLWRRLRSDWLSGSWWTAQSDYYRAMASSGAQRESLCRTLLQQCQSGVEPFAGPAGRVLTARVLALMGEKDPGARKQALDILEPIVTDSSGAIPDPVRLSALIIYFSIKGEIDPSQVQTLAALCRKESCADQLELRLSAGLLELRLKAGNDGDPVGSSRFLVGAIVCRIDRAGGDGGRIPAGATGSPGLAETAACGGAAGR